MHTGSCLCGAVAFEIDGPLPAPSACHCKQCRKQSGHYFAATSAPRAALRLTRDDGLKWYRSSGIAQRGFCGICGSTLFWQGDASATTEVAMGALDAPTGLHLAEHIWIAFKGDYYDIADGLPQNEKE